MCLLTVKQQNRSFADGLRVPPALLRMTAKENEKSRKEEVESRKCFYL